MRMAKVDIASLPIEARRVLELFPEFVVEHFNDSGANGYVLLGQHEVLRYAVAIKIYFHATNEVYQEPALLAAINHDNVLKVLDARRLGDGCSFFMTPVANYGDLGKHLSTYNLSLVHAHGLLCQLLSGLAALHAEPNRLVHRDIKPENLLVHNDRLLIADFGSVRQVSEATGKAPASGHSILFRPPEAFGNNSYFDYSSDTYQVGIVGYLLLGGKLDSDLVTHLTTRERKQLESLNGDWGEQSVFVDACIQRRICTGKLLDWKTVPCFAPRRFVTILRRATTKEGSKYSTVSEFLAELQKIRATLPDWKVIPEGWLLSDWKGRDYLLSMDDQPMRAMKRKHGNSKFITDNRLTGTTREDAFARLANEIGLP